MPTPPWHLVFEVSSITSSLYVYLHLYTICLLTLIKYFKTYNETIWSFFFFHSTLQSSSHHVFNYLENVAFKLKLHACAIIKSSIIINRICGTLCCVVNGF